MSSSDKAPAPVNDNNEQIAKTPEKKKATTTTKTKVKKVKKTFMLHKPVSFENLGKFVSTDFRYAALKAASRGHKNILLRITNTKLVY